MTEKNFDYKYGEQIYRDNGIFTVFVHHYKDEGKWQTYLRKRIMEIGEYRHSEVMKMLGLLLSEK